MIFLKSVTIDIVVDEFVDWIPITYLYFIRKYKMKFLSTHVLLEPIREHVMNQVQSKHESIWFEQGPTDKMVNTVQKPLAFLRGMVAMFQAFLETK